MNKSTIVLLLMVIMSPVVLCAGSDPAVKQAQQYLSNSGYNPGPIDGFLGKNTEDAIRQYQRAQGLTETGRLDHATRQKMGVIAPQTMASNEPKENVKGIEGSFYKWSELKDETGVKRRKLTNKITLDVHPGEPTRYAAIDASGKGMKVAQGKFGNVTYSGSGMTAQTWVGNRDGEHLDEGFYALLGVGTEIELPKHWVSIFGIRCKDGKMLIQKHGIQLSRSTTIDRK